MNRNAMRDLRPARRIHGRRGAWPAVIVGLIVLPAGCAKPQSANESPTELSSRIAAGGIPPAKAIDGSIAIGESNEPVSTVSSRRKSSALAVVNGRPIDSRSFIKTLVDARGLMLLQQLIFLEAVRSEADKRGIRVNDDDIQREYDLTLQNAPDVSDSDKPLTEAQRDVLIDKWTKRNGVPREELAIAMARQALLRKMAEADVRVTADDVREEFKRQFGDHVEVRHLQLPARRTYARIKARLDRGDRFEDLVADYSVNALTKARGGLLPPFTRDDPTVPRSFVNMAFKLKVGEVSPLFESEGSYHLIKLERRISAETTSLGDKRVELERAVRKRRVAERMESLGRELLMKADIRIDEATMREQYNDRRKRGLIEGPALAN